MIILVVLVEPCFSYSSAIGNNTLISSFKLSNLPVFLMITFAFFGLDIFLLLQDIYYSNYRIAVGTLKSTLHYGSLRRVRR